MDDDDNSSNLFGNPHGSHLRRHEDNQGELPSYTRQYVASELAEIDNDFDPISLFHLFSLPQYHEQLKHVMQQADTTLHYSISIK